MEPRGEGRHCGRCDLVVHDVASLTRAEAEELVGARERGQRVCLHVHVRRTDGAILVADGHVEREPIRRGPPSRMIAAAVAAATAMTACSTNESATPEPPVIVAAASPAVPPPSPIDTPPEPPPIVTTQVPSMPAPSPPPAPAANHSPKTAPSKKHYEPLSGF